MPEVHLVGNERAVITENGRVVPGSFTTVTAAEQKAAERKKLAESNPSSAPVVEVKQTIFG